MKEYVYEKDPCGDKNLEKLPLDTLIATRELEKLYKDNKINYYKRQFDKYSSFGHGINIIASVLGLVAFGGLFFVPFSISSVLLMGASLGISAICGVNFIKGQKIKSEYKNAISNTIIDCDKNLDKIDALLKVKYSQYYDFAESCKIADQVIEERNGNKKSKYNKVKNLKNQKCQSSEVDVELEK